jgi:hypothetical protein
VVSIELGAGSTLDFFSHPEVIIEGVTLAIGGIIAFVRLEGKLNTEKERIAEVLKSDRQRIIENGKLIEKLEVRIDRMETKHDVVYNEVRNLLSVIQRSVAAIEGRLSINSKD